MDAAVQGVRQAGEVHYLPRGLLTRAWLRVALGQPEQGSTDLDEAERIAGRGPMKLHLADVHLHRARLFRDRDELQKARELIEAIGYGRRRVELVDADAAAKSW
jgi:hypothetical protein